MGFMDKVKNLFTEEEEVPVEPVKKEIIKVEIPAPTDATRQAPAMVEEKKEEKFSFPVFFDDKDFEGLDKPKEKKQESKPLKREEAYQANKSTKKEEKRLFQPSPIISPVYGILDKNYRKDDITSRKNEEVTYYKNTQEISLDDVRKKAFGTLEDDLENTLLSDYKKERAPLMDEPMDLEKDIFDELGFTEEEPQHMAKDNYAGGYEEVKTESHPMTLEDADMNFDLLSDDESNDSVIEKVSNQPKDESTENIDLNESDLFNLIDSMYEKRDDE